MNSQMKRYIELGLEGSQEQALLSPWSWDMLPFQCGCIHQPGSSLSPTLLELLWRHRCQSFSHLKKVEGRAGNFKLLIIAWSFPVTSPQSGAIQSRLARIKQTPVTQEITRASEALC